MSLQGVSEHTLPVLRKLMEYKELQEYYLVGGTGLSIHKKYRLSEDIDLFYYNPFPGKRKPLPNLDQFLAKIKNDFKKVTVKSSSAKKQYIELDVENVKIQLNSEWRFHRSKKYSKLGEIRLPDSVSLIGMKLITLTLRKEWRDIYDLYALARDHSPAEFKKGYDQIMSSYYCNGSKKAKESLFYKIVDKLRDLDFLSTLYKKESLAAMEPKYDIKPQDAANHFANMGFESLKKQDKQKG